MLSASSNSVVLRALRDDEPVRRVGEHVDEPAHQLDVRRAEAAEREVDERARARRASCVGERRTSRPTARTHVSSRCQVGGERARPLVVDLGGVEREIEPRRLVDQLALRERRCAALDAEGAELLVERREHARVLVPDTRPSPSGRRRGSPRTAAGARDPSARAGCTRRSAPTAAPRRESPGSRRRCPPRRRRAGPRRGSRRSRSSTYCAPSQSARNVGSMNSASCSIVGLRKTGAVSRMKSFQNWPGSSSASGGGPSRISRSSNPCASRLPANDSSMTKTTRCPRSRSTCADADAVVRRAVRALGEEHDRRPALLPWVLSSSRSLARSGEPTRTVETTFNRDLLVGGALVRRKGAHRRGRSGRLPASSRRRRAEPPSSSSTSPTQTAATERYALALRDGRECAGDDPLWPALARAVRRRGGRRAVASSPRTSRTPSSLLDDRARPEALPAPGAGDHPEVELLAALAGLAARAPPRRSASSATASRTSRVQALVARRAGRLGAAHRLARRRRSAPRACRRSSRRSRRRCIARSPSASARPETDSSGFTATSTSASSSDAGGPSSSSTGRAGPACRSPSAASPGRPLPDLASLRLSLAHAARAAHRRSPGFDWRAWSRRGTRRGARALRRRSTATFSSRSRSRRSRPSSSTRGTGSPSGSTCRTDVLPFVLEGGRESRRLPPRHPRGARPARGLPRRVYRIGRARRSWRTRGAS